MAQTSHMVVLKFFSDAQFSFLCRQHARLDNPALHAVTPLGTKYAVYDYYDEIEQSLKMVVNGYIARREYAEV